MELTPKQKAKELIEKFKPHSHFWVHDFGHKKDYDIEQLKNAIECALIAVDEIMDVCPYIDEKIRENEDQLLAFSFQFVSYWQEVKEKLLKM